jgi:hypothetical protein
MARPPRIELSIRQRLLLLTIIPVLGLTVAGTLSLRTLYSEYKSCLHDVDALTTFGKEVEEFVATAQTLQAERNAALEYMNHRDDAKSLEAYRATFGATDRAVSALFDKIDRLSRSKQGALFAEKGQSARSGFASQLPDARSGALESKHTAGDVFQLYIKLAYSALFISECYRGTIETPAGLNIFDAILALQKIQQQELVATDLVTFGLRAGGLQKDELPVMRRQFIVSTENEYYLLKFQPELRAFFKAQIRSSDDATAFYAYLADVAGTLRDNTPLPPFQPKTQTLPEFIAAHFQAYPRVYDFGFAEGAKQLHAIAHVRYRNATIGGAALLAVIALSLGTSLTITRSTRRHLTTVATNIEEASEDVKSASQQLASAGHQMSEDASSFAAGIDQISGNIAEVSNVAETNKQHAARAAASTRQARQAVEAGLATIGDLDGAMNSARGSAQKINQVIARINDISFQTNLLALNAAVEAARAGSAGAGFAVVAGEVRLLAGRCAEAAKESAQLIGDSATDTATAIAKSDELAQRFRHVSTSIHDLNAIVSDISTTFIQQADSIGQINDAIANQRNISQNVAAAAEEIASTAVAMERQVENLDDGVNRLDSLLGGTLARSSRDSDSPGNRAPVAEVFEKDPLEPPSRSRR